MSIAKAKEFALNKHKCQKYGEYPYTKHLDDVSTVLTRYGFTEELYPTLHMGAYLHDVLEDTATSYNDVRKLFGFEVAELVYAVTDELGRNRKERAEKTHPKIKGFVLPTVLKLADRIANVEEAIKDGSDLLLMYKKEFFTFRDHLYTEEELTKKMWEDLGWYLTGVK